MNFKTLLVEKGTISTIILNRPEVLNALNREIIEELAAATKQLAEDSEVKIIILAGNKQAFSAGGDIQLMKDMSPEEIVENVSQINEVFSGIEKINKPVIAALDGYVMGGGLELALCCDFRYSTPDALFGLPETGVGIIPGAGGTQRLSRVVGTGKTKELVFTGKTMTADEALTLGLVQGIYENPLEAVKIASNKILDRSMHANIQAKKIINQGIKTSLGEGLKLELQGLKECFEHPDQKEGMHAFLEKRKPNFE